MALCARKASLRGVVTDDRGNPVNDYGVVVLDKKVSIKPAKLAPLNYMSGFTQPKLNKTLFTLVGYGFSESFAESGDAVIIVTPTGGSPTTLDMSSRKASPFPRSSCGTGGFPTRRPCGS